MNNSTYYTPNYTIKKYKSRDLNQKQIRFCEAYLAEGLATTAAKIAGYSSPARAGAYLLKCKRVRDYLNNQEPRYASVPITLEYKMNKLYEVVEATIPEGLRYKENINHNAVGKGITAIAELNRIQGHYAPEKNINVNVDTDIAEANALMQKLLDENKREY